MASDDSSDEELRVRIGNVPLDHYKELPILGYDVDGKAIPKMKELDALQKHILKSEDPNWWKTLTDELNAKEIKLTPEMIALIQRIRARKTAAPMIDPYNDLDLTTPKQIHGINDDVMPPKRRFVPSKWERMKSSRLARAIEKGWLKPKPAPKVEVWDIWSDEVRTSTIPTPPKWVLPGHIESYNPPEEYLFTEEEKQAWLEKDPQNRDIPFLPQKYASLRRVPGYENVLKERFERCLDLFLCPRIVRPRINVDPESLIPELPDPESLKPFPEKLGMVFKGHEEKVLCIDWDKTGEWLASGDSAGKVKIWEALTGKCLLNLEFKKKVTYLAWNPVLPILAIVSGKKLHLHSIDLLDKYEFTPIEQENEHTTWKWDSSKVVIEFHKQVSMINWHGKGDYFATLCPRANLSNQVLVHSLSKGLSTKMFSKKSKGDIKAMVFHPKRALFFAATQKQILAYNLKQGQLVKRFKGLDGPAHLHIHSSGDFLLAACEDCKLQWYDYDLSLTPYKTFFYHKKSLTYAHTHRKYPLMATASNDRTVHLFHAKIHSDYMNAPTILPIKILRIPSEPVQVQFHPKQPWIGVVSDLDIHLYI